MELANLFFAGAVSFWSACVWPLIPGYLSLALGISLREMRQPLDEQAPLRRAIIHSLCYVLGFAVTFALLGAYATGIETPLRPYLSVIKKITGAATLLMGLLVTGLLPDRFPRATYVGSLLIGAAFVCAWIPCVGPLLGSLFTQAAAPATRLSGISLLFIYALGFGLSFSLMGLAGHLAIQHLQKYHPVRQWGGPLAGSILILYAVLIFTGKSMYLMWLFSPKTFASP